MAAVMLLAACCAVGGLRPANTTVQGRPHEGVAHTQFDALMAQSGAKPHPVVPLTVHRPSDPHALDDLYAEHPGLESSQGQDFQFAALLAKPTAQPTLEPTSQPTLRWQGTDRVVDKSGVSIGTCGCCESARDPPV
jgi:hypothetical protein